MENSVRGYYYFRRIFREQTGPSPDIWRKQSQRPPNIAKRKADNFNHPVRQSICVAVFSSMG